MRLTELQVEEFFKDKKVIILGSAPCVTNANELYLDKFDIIVRTNNYTHFNKCKRTDVYYSFFGSSILDVEKKLMEDRPKFLFFKYPFNFDFTRHKKSKEIPGKSGNFKYIQELRFDIIKNYNHFAQSQANFISNFIAIGSIPTTGVAAIFDVLRYQPKELHIAGFDFFASGKHNINQPWTPKEGRGHDFEAEKAVIDGLIKDNLLRFPTRPYNPAPLPIRPEPKDEVEQGCFCTKKLNEILKKLEELKSERNKQVD